MREETTPYGRERRVPVHLWLLAVALAVSAAVAALLFVVRPKFEVEWSEVLEAVGGCDTMHGHGRVCLRDGTEWDYALWARIKGPGRAVTRGMVKPANERAAARDDAPEELAHLCNAMDVCGENGIVARLAAVGRVDAARRTEWGGEPILVAEVNTQQALGVRGEVEPDWWRLFVDRQTKRVVGVELFTAAGEGRLLSGTCEYDYDLPLPPGFEEAPG